MTYRKYILAAGTCLGILVAFESLAMPITELKPTLKAIIGLVNGDGDDDGQSRHQESGGEGRQVSDDYGGDDDDGCKERNGAVQQQNDTAPANGLFAPGTKPKVHLN